MIGTIRRECVDWVIPLSESHLRRILKSVIVRHELGDRVLKRGLSEEDHSLQAFAVTNDSDVFESDSFMLISCAGPSGGADLSGRRIAAPEDGGHARIESRQVAL